MSGQHTPGPWTADEERATDIVIRNSQRDPVALGYTSGWDKPTARANARLIAAAPELLKTLIDLIPYVDECEKLGQIQPMQAKAIREVAGTTIAKQHTRGDHWAAENLLAHSLQARIESLEHEKSVLVKANEQANKAVVRLRADKAELLDLVKRAGLRARHCDGCSKDIMNIVKEARAIHAKAETAETDNPKPESE